MTSGKKLSYDEVLKLVTEYVTDVAASAGGSPGVIGSDTVLFGSNSFVDSLDLVNIIVKVEESVLETMGKKITVVDEASLVTGDSPFRTVGSLTKLVVERIDA